MRVLMRPPRTAYADRAAIAAVPIGGNGQGGWRWQLEQVEWVRLDHPLDALLADPRLIHRLGEHAKRLRRHRVVALAGVAHEDAALGSERVDRLDHPGERRVVPHRRHRAVAEL